MRVVLLGPGDVDGRTAVIWDVVRSVMKALGPQDELVHSGGNGVGEKVDSIARRAKGMERRRLPRIDVQLPEIGRYERAEALRRNAMQLVHVRMPDVIVYIGDGEDEETAPVLELAQRTRTDGTPLYPRTSVQEAETFVQERGRR